MKTRLLTLLLAVLTVSASLAAQDTDAGMYIDWDHGNAVQGMESSDALKIDGTLHNEDDYAKRLLFTYEMGEIFEGHSASICFADNCFFLFDGDGDKPLVRDAQNLAAMGSTRLFCDALPFGIKGQTVVKYCIFDSVDIERQLCFDLTYAAGVPLVSVQEASEIGLSVGPNPATDHVTVRGDQAVNIEGASLYSINGTIVRSYAVAGSETQTFTTNGLAPGIYQLLLSMGDGRTVRASISVIR